MKRYIYLLTAAGLSVTGCMSPQGTPNYTASGALAGGATGVVLGSMSRDPRAGAAAGGAAGAVLGGLIGHGMDQAQNARLQAQAPQTLQRVEQGVALTVSDVKELVAAGIGDDLIISQIRNSRTVYHLRTADIVALKNAGTSNAVIDCMINTPAQIRSASAAVDAVPAPPPPRQERIAPPPGPGYVWVAGAWIRCGEGWRWRGGYWQRSGHRSDIYPGPHHPYRP